MANQSKTLRSIHAGAQAVDWEAVYQAELTRVYNFFLYKTGDRQPAQDLTATTFERAWKRRASYHPGQASPSTWIFGIARIVFKEHLRRQSYRKERFAPFSPDDRLAAGMDIEANIQRDQDKERLHRMILELPEREQELIAMKYGAGLTNREIAEITALSETNVGSILHRTVKKLRQKWDMNHG